MAENNEKIEQFELPRPDWYDNEGRIYKDRLIENFNAIESKLIELSELNDSSKSIPDISDVTFDDVTLDDDDDKIVNLDSLVRILDLECYPESLVFNNDKECDITYYKKVGEHYQLQRQYNEEIENISSSNKYIYLDCQSGKVIADSSAVSPEHHHLIGVYDNGRILGINTKGYININLLPTLANMRSETFNYTFSASTRDDTTNGKGIVRNNRVIGSGDTNTKTGSSNPVTFRDLGRRLN